MVGSFYLCNQTPAPTNSGCSIIDVDRRVELIDALAAYPGLIPYQGLDFQRRSSAERASVRTQLSLVYGTRLVEARFSGDPLGTDTVIRPFNGCLCVFDRGVASRNPQGFPVVPAVLNRVRESVEVLTDGQAWNPAKPLAVHA